MSDDNRIPSGETVTHENHIDVAGREAYEEAVEEGASDLASLSDEEFIEQVALIAQDEAFDVELLQRLYILSGRYAAWLTAQALKEGGVLDAVDDLDDLEAGDDDDDPELEDDDDDSDLIDEDPEPDDELS